MTSPLVALATDALPVLQEGRPVLFPLKCHEDLRGYLYEIWRADMTLPFTVQQVYCSAIRPGVIKGWHKHRAQWDFVTCVHGEIQLAMWKDMEAEGYSYILNQRNLLACAIPPMWWHGWRNIGADDALIINCVSACYNADAPDEERMDPHTLNGEIWIPVDG